MIAGAVAMTAAGDVPLWASTATAAPTRPAKFAVTFSATQTSTFTYDRCAPMGLTLNAALSSVGPITATLTGTTLAFTPNLSDNRRRPNFQPLRVTASVSSEYCPNLSNATTCGPTTGMIKPGLKELDAAAGKLTVRYQSGYRFFPGSDACSSGMIEMGVTYPDTGPGMAPLNPGNLLKQNVTEVIGTWTHDQTFSPPAGVARDTTGVEHTVVKFTVRFVRLP